MDLVRDVLDKSVVDRHGHEMGRVDGILLDQDPGQPLRVAAILIGPAVLAYRLHPALGRVVTAVERCLGVDQGRPARIDFSDVDEIDRRIRLVLTIGETSVAAIENWLRKWVIKLPGS